MHPPLSPRCGELALPSRHLGPLFGVMLLVACSSGSEGPQSPGNAGTSLGGTGPTTGSNTASSASRDTGSVGGGSPIGTVVGTQASSASAGGSAAGATTTTETHGTVAGVTGAGGVETVGSVSTSGSGTEGGAGGGDAGGAGGASGSGGSETSGSSGNGGGGSGNQVEGNIAIDDPVPGFASVAGGTSGGGMDLASAVTVNTMSALQGAASGSAAAIVLVEPGNYSGSLSIGANKTIIGLAPGVEITGNVRISGEGTSNVIVRNIAVQGEPCASYDECRAGADAVYVGNGAHHVWLDHLDISDGQDGNCDVTQEGDFVTISWSKFYYTYDKEHRFSNLIAGSDEETNSRGKLNITYMNSEWGERVDSRQPRGRFGNIHMLNNYHHTGGGQIHGVGLEMALIAEQNVYEESGSIWTDMGSPRGWRGIGNIGTASDLNDSRGTVFEIPYDYTPLPAAEVKAAVTSPDCGAGNTCTLRR